MFKFDKVVKKYSNGNVALDNVSFSINEGDFVFLVGPSGAGKSTILRLAIKEEEPTSGNIFFENILVNKLRGNMLARYRRSLGVVFQDFKLLNGRTVEENVSFVLEVRGLKRPEIKGRVERILELVGLINKRNSFPEALSGGEQQRVSIARALVTDPKILIADEPTGNLDRANAWDIMQLLNKINNWGTTVIVATHDTEIIDSLNKRVIKFESGRIVKDYIGGYIDKF